MDIEDGGAKLIDVARRATARQPPSRACSTAIRPSMKSVRERVVRAARELGYVPNGSARALRSTRTRLVGAIIPTLDHAIYATMVDGLQARLTEKSVSLIINTSMYDIDLEYDQAKLLVERGAESIVLVGSITGRRHSPCSSRRRIDYVFTYTSSATEAGAAVGFDNEKAGRDGGPLSARPRPYQARR